MTRPTIAERRRWYARAERGGAFQDLESASNPDGPLSDRGNPRPEWGAKSAGKDRVLLTPGEVQTLTDFYSAASRMLHDRHWSCRAERAIWEMFCAGASTIRIARRLGRMRLKRPVSAPSHSGYVTKRTVVDVVSVTAVVRRLREELLGLRRPMGRPRKPWGYGSNSRVVGLRLDDQEQAALAALVERLQVPERQAIRAALLAAART